MRKSSYDCLTEQEVEEFILKRLASPELDAVEEHLLACAPCVGKVEAEERFVRDFRPVAELFQKKQTAEPARVIQREESSALSDMMGWLARFWLRPQGWMAAGAAVAVVMIVLVAGQQRKVQADQPVYLDITLSTHRSGDTTAETKGGAVSGRRAATLRLTVDLTELPQLPEYPIDMVDSAGNPVLHATLKPQDGKLVWQTGLMPKNGTYWVRLLDPKDPDLLLREFGLQVMR